MRLPWPTALSEGRLFGAGLDAFSKEPPIGSPLLTLEQTVVTPHFAGATIDNFSSVIERAVSNARQYLSSGTLPDCGRRIHAPGSGNHDAYRIA